MPRELVFPDYDLIVRPIQWCGFHRSVPSDGFVPSIGPLCTDCYRQFKHLIVTRAVVTTTTMEATA